MKQIQFKLRGEFATRRVWLNEEELSPKASQKVRNHSPDGFNWGYGGSGPAQLALAILLKLVPEEAQANYQDLKWSIIEQIPQDSFDISISYGPEEGYSKIEHDLSKKSGSQQIVALYKAKAHPTAVIGVWMGDFIEFFGSDAEFVAKELNIALTKRNDVPMAGIPYHTATQWLEKLRGAREWVIIAGEHGKPLSLVDEKIVAQCDVSVMNRRRIELAVVRKLIADLLAAGYTLAANNGDDDVLQSQDADKLIEELFAGDESKLLASKDGNDSSYALLVLGNDGFDVISDWLISDPVFSEVVDKVADWAYQTYGQ